MKKQKNTFYKQIYLFLVIGILFFHPYAYSHILTIEKIKETPSLQIVSEVYKKQPYIPVPTATIESSLRREILDQVKAAIHPIAQAEFINLKGEWVETLRCRPALNIGLYSPESQQDKEKTLCGILLIYPKNYRDLLQDPLSENPPPIDYVGSTRRLAFFHYPQQQNKKILDKIVEHLKLN
ncbi:MAG: hypothetical protein HUU50_10260 [Candidatus Brocadiae bacterium]|nr:hypothetical protein [Candidatus Brocadiia bacterium]